MASESSHDQITAEARGQSSGFTHQVHAALAAFAGIRRTAFSASTAPELPARDIAHPLFDLLQELHRESLVHVL
jgi:hypothetical protein